MLVLVLVLAFVPVAPLFITGVVAVVPVLVVGVTGVTTAVVAPAMPLLPLVVVVVAAGVVTAVVVLAMPLLPAAVDAVAAGVVGVVTAVVVPAVPLLSVAAAGVAAGVVVAGAEVVGAVATGPFEMAAAVVTESEFPSLPPPPHATSEVQTRVERTRLVIVLNGNVMMVSSGFNNGGCCFRLFIIGPWNNEILRHGNKFCTAKNIFSGHFLEECDR